MIPQSKLSGNNVQFGATVVLIDLASGEEKTIQIAGAEEADLRTGKISVTSVLGRSLLSHAVGEEVAVVTRAGSQVYQILEIKYV